MKFLNPVFFAGILSAFYCTGAFSAAHQQCVKYDNCDHLVACELAHEVVNKGLVANQTPDYNTAAAVAISSRSECGTYPDSMNNVDAIISNNPYARLTIDWNKVKLQLNNINIDPNSASNASKLNGEFESLLPWFGILVVKKGSLDKYANSELPIISTEYMKNNRALFYPDNSDKPLGMWSGCTHSNHTAHDKDVINMAAHITMDEADSRWSGNDYYVYDGKGVYWGTAMLVGEVALALVTLGASSAVSASKATVQGAAATARGIEAVNASVKVAKFSRDSAKIKTAYESAEAAVKGTTAAAKASRAKAIKDLSEAGVTVGKGTRADQLNKIGGILKAAATGNQPISWTSALRGNPWKLAKTGVSSLKPKNNLLYGPGATAAQRIKRGVIAASGAGFGTALIKAYGYSSAAMKNYADGVNFNSFGLLSADDLEGRENEVSHGAWLQFEETGTKNEQDAMDEALAFAEEFTKDVQKINADNPKCDVDVYVVQPGISNPAKLGRREIYYLIQNPAGSLRITK